MLTVAQALSLVVATAATGLSAGLLYAYACSVMPGLARTDDRTFVAAMRAINDAILNGWFALSSVGALLATPLTVALHLTQPTAVRWWAAAALALQLLVVTVTARGNVPLNHELGAQDPHEPTFRFDLTRDAFEAPWNHWHRARTLAGVAAFGCLLIAMALR
jgi:uncharacterized membrane protein